MPHELLRCPDVVTALVEVTTELVVVPEVEDLVVRVLVLTQPTEYVDE